MARIKTWGLFSGRLLSDMKLWVLHPRWTVLFYSVFNETFLPVVCCEDLVALINAVFSTTSISFTLGMFPGLPVEVDVSSVSAHPSHVPDMAVRFSLLYPGCAKRPTLLWKLKEPKGSQWMPEHVQQMYSTHCLPKTLPHLDAVPQVVSTDLALWLITTCIAINSDRNFILLKQRMSWEKFLELQFSAEGSECFGIFHGYMLPQCRSESRRMWDGSSDTSLCVHLCKWNVFLDTTCCIH